MLRLCSLADEPSGWRARYGASRPLNRYTNFSPAVSPQALKRMRQRVKAIGLLSLVHLSIEEIARTLNPVLQGWIQYYGRFYRTYPFRGRDSAERGSAPLNA